MTVYERNYRERLNEMIGEIVHNFGHESKKAMIICREVEKYIDNANYQNRETMEQLFASLMRF